MQQESRTRRLAPWLAGVAAIGYCAEGAIVLRAPQPDQGWHASGYAVEVAFVLALVASLPLLGLLRRGEGRLTATGVWLARAGFAAMLASAVASLPVGGNRLGPVFLVGILASLVGLLILAGASLRHRTGPWWLASALTVGLVLSIAFGNHGGGIILGVAWAAVALAFRDSNRTTAPVPVLS